jgi:hypothetical protein
MKRILDPASKNFLTANYANHPPSGGDALWRILPIARKYYSWNLFCLSHTAENAEIAELFFLIYHNNHDFSCSGRI